MSLRLARRLSAAAFFAALIAIGRGWLPGVQGAFPSVDWWGLTLADPLAVLETAAASRRLEPELLLGGLLVALPALILGRVFCGWLCPLGLVLELQDPLRERFRKWLPERSLPRSWKYGLALACVAGSAAAGFPLFQSVSPINWLVWGAGAGAGLEWLLVAGVLALEWAFRRAFCASLCPVGAVHALLGRWSRFRILVGEAAGRPGCRRCSRACPLGIPVMEEHVQAGAAAVTDPDCSRCGDCAEACPRTVLVLGFGPSGGAPAGESSTDLSTIASKGHSYEV